MRPKPNDVDVPVLEHVADLWNGHDDASAPCCMAIRMADAKAIRSPPRVLDIPFFFFSIGLKLYYR